MIYLPDTNVWIAYLNPDNSPVKVRFRSHPVEDIGLSTVVKAELLFGAYRSARRQANLAVLDSLFRAFPSVSFDDPAAEQYGMIRAELAAKGTPIGPNDLFIAATALAHRLILVTHNTREFGRVTALELEDWLENA